jgi:hypothetical protein
MTVDLTTCLFHDDRVAVVLTFRYGIPVCWECYLPTDIYLSRFGSSFYGNGPAAAHVTRSACDGPVTGAEGGSQATTKGRGLPCHNETENKP